MVFMTMRVIIIMHRWPCYGDLEKQLYYGNTNYDTIISIAFKIIAMHTLALQCTSTPTDECDKNQTSVCRV